METLATRIAREGPLKPMDAVGWAIRLAKNLERIHARKIVHGRITPYCLMIELADCASVGMLVDAERLPDPVSYHSPERAAGEEEKPSDDTWGVAATLYEALTGKPLFDADADDEATRAKILAPDDGQRVVLDAGGTALQGILNRALARDWMERTNNITALRRELEALRPATRFGALMPLLEDTRKAAPASQRPPPGMLEDDEDGPTLVASTRDLMKVATMKGKPAEAEAAPSAPATSNATPKPPTARSSPAPAKPSPSMSPEGSPSPAAVANRPKRESAADGQFDFAGLRSRLLGTTDAPPAKHEGDSVTRLLPAEPPEPEPEPALAPAPIALAREPEAAPVAAAPPPSAPQPMRPPPPPVPQAVRPPPPPVPQAMPPAAPKAPAPPPPPAIEPPTQKKGGSRAGLYIFLLLLLGGAGAAYRFKEPLLSKVNELRGIRVAETAAPPAASTAQAPAAASTPAPAAMSAAPGAASAEASASAPAASASATPTAAPATPGDVNACVKPLFPPDTFTGDAMPDFSFLCKETDPRKGIASMKTRIVLGNGGHVSEGMKEWALSGWYQLATFSVVRSRCCVSPPPLSLADNPGRCARVDDRLNDLGAAAALAKDVKDAKLKEAMDGFTGAIHCMVRIGTTGAFTRHDNPQGGEDTAFMKMLTRVVSSNQ